MKVYPSIEAFELTASRPVVTLGTFDGVHLGHQSILNRLKDLSNQINGESLVITFDPHPRMVLFPDDHQLQLLQTLDEKLASFEKAGIQHAIVQPFTSAFSRISAEQFLRDYLLSRLQAKVLVIGYDHRFGKNREGDIHTLRALAKGTDLEIIEISAKEVEEIKISSTKIRNHLMHGDVAKAHDFLGYAYTLSGEVYQGRQLGRTLGFPTANITLPGEHKLIPSHGVYAVKCQLEGRPQRIKGVMNLGIRPTIDGTSVVCEVHLFDFNEDIYGHTLQVELFHFIRHERRFEHIDALKSQIELDMRAALSLLGNSNA